MGDKLVTVMEMGEGTLINVINKCLYIDIAFRENKSSYFRVKLKRIKFEL